MRSVAVTVCLFGLAGCVTTQGPAETLSEASMTAVSDHGPESARTVHPLLDSPAAARTFREVVGRVEPVAEAMCRERTADDPGYPCDVRVSVDPSRDAEANAFLTVDRTGRPTLIFTMRLIEMARTPDELAFAFAHEMGHLLGRHIDRVRGARPRVSMVGTPATVCGAGQAGGSLARETLRAFEREADLIGAEITGRAGYDAARGVRIIARLDADRGGHACLGYGGTHPASVDHIEAVIAATRAMSAAGETASFYVCAGAR